jgi:copper chaperone NosL
VKLPTISRVLVAMAALLLVALYFVPLWQIALGAPQYPEGLGMRIWINTIAGVKPHDLTNINALNHYIGMRPIEPDVIPELRFMPWILGGLIVAGLVVAISGSRRLLWGWLASLVGLAAAGLVDFWRWGYDYGHNLDEVTAVIKVPGMSYQPPVIGTKQLLNFTATSLPDVGAWLALVAFGLGATALWIALRRRREAAPAARAATAAQERTRPEYAVRGGEA